MNKCSYDAGTKPVQIDNVRLLWGLSELPRRDRVRRLHVNDIWAKRSDDSGAFHPLICHLIDVAEVARAMLDSVVSPATLAWLAEELGVKEAALKAWVVWFAGMHDIGKANESFYRRDPGQSAFLPHATVSSGILLSKLPESPFSLDELVARRISAAIGGHHGIIPLEYEIQGKYLHADRRTWRRVWPELIKRFTGYYSVPDKRPVAIDNARALWLAGFISVVDWIGSNTQFFPFAIQPGTSAAELDLDAYRERSRESARVALRELGWLAVPSTTAPMSFQALFPFIAEPNNLQQTAIEIAEELDRPGLVIIEAPMGEGKTEAALYLADRANVRWGMRGAYVALPTMATSNQMFDRVCRFLDHRYREFVQVQLQHGQAALSDEVEALRKNFGDFLSFTDEITVQEGEAGTDEDRQGSAIASSWFAGRKQALLAPFGVGTIDQLLLSVLPIKHYFVRLFGVSNKTIILDEVHAYDAYMTTLIERLLGWLAAMNCHVILLSATLPAEKRARLLAAYRNSATGDVALPTEEDAVYPRISWVSGERSGSRTVVASERGRKRLGIHWLELNASEPDDDLAERLDLALRNGGCAAVICNTVRRAQEVFGALERSGHFPGEELGLFHAQFLVKDRRTIEKQCLDEFGKESTRRPARKVLVATQVIEQSLDLDFDLMVTEIAPIDLLLQRSGRLHRHKRDSRPPGLESPELWIIAPTFEGSIPVFGRGNEYVYFPRILLDTWRVLRDRPFVDIPEDVAGLIAAVYGGESPPLDNDPELDAVLASTFDRMSERIRNDARQAEFMEIKAPSFTDELGLIAPINRDDEDADVNPKARAATRLGDPSVSVVFFYGTLKRARFEKDGPEFDLTKPDREVAKLCLMNSASVSRWEIVNDLIWESPPTPWKENSFLRTMRALSLDEETGEGGGFGRSWTITVNGRLGIQIAKTEGA